MYLLVHIANCLSLASYLVRDILWLRILSVTAALCSISYLLMTSDTPASAIAWSMVFASINVAQIVRLVHERRPVFFEPEQKHIYEMGFQAIKPRDFLRLWQRSRWLDAPAQHQVIVAGQAPAGLMTVSSGEVEVLADGRAVARLRAGQFIGEMNFITGELPKASVVATQTTRLRVWPRTELNSFLGHHLELAAALRGVLGADLVRKLQSQSVS